MPSFLLSPFVKWSLAALGGAMIVHWAVKEARRINTELHPSGPSDPVDERAPRRPRERDPRTGVYRPK